MAGDRVHLHLGQLQSIQLDWYGVVVVEEGLVSASETRVPAGVWSFETRVADAGVLGFNESTGIQQ